MRSCRSPQLLQIFQDLTDLFSRAEVPLVHEVVPMLEALEHALQSVYEQEHGDLPPVIRIAAKAALLVLGRYYARTDDCEVYRIAMGMF
jgi:hypothetical protein